ncbi:MAG: hypothetical protein AAGI23_17720 [Bacteroidota bacterium]
MTNYNIQWRQLLYCCLFLLGAQFAYSQSFAFGPKGGLSVGIQSWDGFEQDPLLSYHGILFIESAPESNAFALFAQAGYHVRGSAIRNRFAQNIINNQVTRVPPQEFQFRNVSLTLGAKQKSDLSATDIKTYYLFGVRGDYTINTNLDEYEFLTQRFGPSIYPLDAFVQRFNYGVTLGGGFEYPVSDLVSGLLELTINPDLSNQYRQPQIPGVYNPFTGNNTTLSERLIKNVTFEVTLGLRLLRKVVYVD